MKKIFIFWIIFFFVIWFSYSCDFVIEKNYWYFKDWKIWNKIVKPWNLICIKWWKRSYIKFIWFKWTKQNPIIIKNYKWLVNIESNHSYGFSVENCKYLKILWNWEKNIKYWFKIKAPKAWSVMSIWWWSSDIEVSNVEIYWNSINDSYTAFSAKTDPKCNSNFIRWKFEMKNISFHNSYIHDINQWLYFGRTFFTKKIKCWNKTIQWHILEWVEIYDNLIERVWQDWMQISSAISKKWKCLIHNNLFKNTSLKNLYWQRSSITIWWWSNCSVYNNVSINSNWPWILFFWFSWNIFNNLIINAWITWSNIDWIFLDHRSWSWYIWWSIKIYNNTIINPERNWIRFYNKYTKKNEIHNNLIINPKSLYNTNRNHRSIKEWWSFIYLEKWRIDRKNINNWKKILSYLSIWKYSNSDNLWLTNISNDIFEKIKNSEIFWVNEYIKILSENKKYSPNKNDLKIVDYFVKVIKKKYPNEIQKYKKLIFNLSKKYQYNKRLYWILNEIYNIL